MIEFLKNWCEGIMISVFITVIIEMLVPEGNIKKYVRVIIGVYMVFIILNPIISGIDKFDIDNILEFDRNYKTQETSVSNDDILSLYSKAMETDIKEKFDNIKDITIPETIHIEYQYICKFPNSMAIGENSNSKLKVGNTTLFIW